MGLLKNFSKIKESNTAGLTLGAEMENEEEITAVIAAAVASMDEEQEIVAAITAAISCILGKSTSEFIVRNITRTSQTGPVWALKGRMRLMR